VKEGGGAEGECERERALGVLLCHGLRTFCVSTLVLVLVLRNCAVTVSSTGAENQFQADDNGHVGRPCEVSLAPSFPELFQVASYGASAVTRTSGRGHVAEAKTNVIEVTVGGFSEAQSGFPLRTLQYSVFSNGYPR